MLQDVPVLRRPITTRTVPPPTALLTVRTVWMAPRSQVELPLGAVRPLGPTDRLAGGLAAELVVCTGASAGGTGVADEVEAKGTVTVAAVRGSADAGW